MKTFRILTAGLALAAALTISAGAARAQAAAAAAAASVIRAPIARVLRAVGPKTTPAGDYWLKASVIHFDSHEIIVREAANGRMIHTFTYASALQPKMQTIESEGGYQYGDQVRILYQGSQTVALKIHGKPSKPQ
jgi:hypothetical protein